MSVLPNLYCSVKRLGAVRDGLIVLGAVLYGAGYIAWSLYAWMNKLPPRGAVDAQYFIAGVPVLLVLVAGWRVGVSVSRFYAKTWSPWVERRSPSIRLFILILLGIPTAALYIYILRAPSPSGPSRTALLNLTIALLGTFVNLLFLAALVAVAFTRDDDAQFRRMPAWLAHLFVVTIAFVAAAAYLRFAYSRIPLVLGGAAPRPAVIYISATASPAVIGQLTGNSRMSREKPDLAVPLLVYDVTDKSMLVARGGPKRGETWEIVEINRDDIEAVVWRQE